MMNILLKGIKTIHSINNIDESYKVLTFKLPFATYCLFGSFIYLMYIPIDWFYSKENFLNILILRIIAPLVIFALWYIANNFKKISFIKLQIIALVVAIIYSSTVTYIVAIRGPANVYITGIICVCIGTVAILPWSSKFLVISSLISVGPYLMWSLLISRIQGEESVESLLLAVLGVTVNLTVSIVAWFIGWSLRIDDVISKNELKISLEERLHLLRFAIIELIKNEQPSELLLKECPGLIEHWMAIKKQLSDTLREQQNQDLDIAMGKIVRQIIHDIKLPVKILKRHINSLVGNKPELDMVLAATEQLVTITEKLYSNKYKVAPDIVHECHVKEIIEICNSVVEEAKVLWNEHNIDLKFFTDNAILNNFKITVDTVTLKRILHNFIKNSMEAYDNIETLKDLSKRILINLKSANESLILEVTDFGKGIPISILPDVGKRGFSYSKTEGSGLGLSGAKEAVSNWNAELRINSIENKGTTVQIIWHPA